MRLMQLGSLLIFCTVWMSLSAEPLGTAFTYQGELQQSGEAADGTFDFQFELYDADNGGIEVAPLVLLEDVVVTAGIFTVELDFGATPFAGDARWLEVAVREGGSEGGYTQLLPRQAVNPTPYALYAERLTTGTVWSTSGNAETTPGTHYLGTSDDQALEIRVNNDRVMRYTPGDGVDGPNVLGGWSGNHIEPAVLGATIAGGGGPGLPNTISDNYGTIGGGFNNVVGNDDGNALNTRFATVGGGGSNESSGITSTVGGGGGNVASGSGSTIGGGSFNEASGIRSTIGGGEVNVASGLASTVPGGSLNDALGNYSFAAGHQSKANHDGAFVWADNTGTPFESTDTNQFLIRASGGVGIGTDNPLAKLHIHAEDSEAPLLIQPGSTSEHLHLVPRTGQPMGATEGDIYARDNGIIYYRSLSAWTAMNAAADFSELILPVGSGIEAHDGTAAYEGEIGFSEIISINDQGHYVRCQRPYDDRISGIESGDRGLYSLPQGSPERAAGQRQFGALGHVKLKVSAENGPIKPGDFLTCSGSQPGAGMRATRTGRVVGIAKQAFDGEQEKVGLIEVFVNPHTWLADSSPVTEAIGNDVESLRRELLVLKAENTKLWERLNDIEKLIDQDHLVMDEKAREPF